MTRYPTGTKQHYRHHDDHHPTKRHPTIKVLFQHIGCRIPTYPSEDSNPEPHSKGHQRHQGYHENRESK
ncbi:MAG: hypothetical protein HN617_07935 [Planctomycetaceae bacterium]|nr:hypothetical protein [Planctomycetaceae bacterium]MBT4726436.1 hypothetical protein [Planctomycetaceae bacterium]MBT4845081.1 hypothetical protein [Planctomycetaceae bacterium]MBT5126299.1 hypothetical protein [Planctomycetaceae bacterium]MBT5598970.1 hypothetical protein [Planctomycetaceae bacterium]